MVSASEPVAPTAAPSVGVAKPKRMLPSEASTSTAGGTSPCRNSFSTAIFDAACSASGNAGPSDGLIAQRTSA